MLSRVPLQFMLYPFGLVVSFSLALTLLAQLSDTFRDFCSMSMDAHIVLGGALSFLVVFRTNSSYDRWWEARKELQNVVNSCRSHATAVASSLNTPEATERVFMLLVLFLVSLKAWLRDEKIGKKELGGRMDWKTVKVVNRAACPPLACVHMISRDVRDNLPVDDKSTKDIDESQINAAIFVESVEITRSMIASVGACERIKATPSECTHN